jgi:hypothetical protein
MCLFTMALALLGCRMAAGPMQSVNACLSELWVQFGPAAVASLLLLPLVVYDLLQVTNRFAGPIFRLRRSMRDLAQGMPVAPVRFRDGDFWQDFASDFNLVAEKAQNSAAESSNSDPTASENDSRLVCR